MTHKLGIYDLVQHPLFIYKIQCEEFKKGITGAGNSPVQKPLGGVILPFFKEIKKASVAGIR